ncbi:hypothetical protein [Chitinilyticum piscinae]|uniref:Uncharacterized protein n=1 Tax=Chitinilyticum piscinae TaxID=2866724 RepID=A0A8J7FKP6_9NEIS|nr:hypothetical protein [Chitinilyticum piscinae]MBE9609797.1 hypothetical protein [Chitinilyticum piscinae]
MHAPLFGSTPHDWLHEMSTPDLMRLAHGLSRLQISQPSAFIVFKAKSMQDAIQCILMERAAQESTAA